jgi:hypothetical protein
MSRNKYFIAMAVTVVVFFNVGIVKVEALEG